MLTSPEQTAIGKDLSNPFMVVMTYQKSYSIQHTMIHVLSVEVVFSSPWIITFSSLALSRNRPIHRLDVKNAFLNGDLSETVYMYQPLGFVDARFPQHVCRLQRHGSEVAYLLIYVDDIVLTTSSTNLLQRIISSLHKEFDMTDLGALNYFLGISVTLQQVCLHMHDPREPHLAAFKRVLRYVRAILDFGLQLYASITEIIYSHGQPQRQHTLSKSSAEAEYKGVANVVVETAWLRNLLRELHIPLLSATLVYCDNVSAIYMTANPVQHQWTKHIEIDIHFVRDMVARGQVRVLHVPSRYQYADIFTNGLSSALFEEFRSSLSVRSSLAQTAEEC
ncbi:ribonuclease H-like domain-containing protein [Tanacetum coccineum]